MQNNEKKSLNSGITMKSELKKVIWPTGKQTVKSTAVTIAFVLMISLILVVFNLLFDFISEKYYSAVLGIDEKQNNELVISGDLIQSLVSGEESGEISGESETIEPVSEVE